MRRNRVLTETVIRNNGLDGICTSLDNFVHIDFLSTDFELRIGSGGTTHSTYYSRMMKKFFFMYFTI